ncbi:hypothetical protein ONZ45_g6243 [Pleurotus djamor]|nr:hypothetical protein ONZ45_g6243 [Pleurotus djamor]
MQTPRMSTSSVDKLCAHSSTAGWLSHSQTFVHDSDFDFILLHTVVRRRRRQLPLPPGPSRLPIVGNLFNIPKTHQWLQYQKWAAEFDSDILYTEVFGTPNIILNTLEAANELLNRRSAVYADRPRLRMLELMGQNFNFGILPYGERWRARRRIFWQEYMPANAHLREPIQYKYAKTLLRTLLWDPKNFLHHNRYSLGCTIMEVSYGITPLPKDDPIIALGDNVMRHFQAAPIFGAFLIDLFPPIQYLPTWFPGAAFKRSAKASCLAVEEMLNVPYAKALKLIDDGFASSSFITRAVTRLRGLSMTAEDEAALKDAVAVGYEGGIETTPSALNTFFAAMVLYPDVQQRAREELDAVIDRLPEPSDYPHLPYVQAVMLEVLRWEVIVPLGVSHAVMSDDEYRGYHIPAKSAITVNMWAILNDPIRFPEPRKFRPERFIIHAEKDGQAKKVDKSLADVVLCLFGFGRRICPGRFMAMESLWLAIASVLYTFDIQKLTDDGGKPITPEIEYEPLFIRKVHPFQCSIKPRSERVRQLVEDSEIMLS